MYKYTTNNPTVPVMHKCYLHNNTDNNCMSTFSHECVSPQAFKNVALAITLADLALNREVNLHIIITFHTFPHHFSTDTVFFFFQKNTSGTLLYHFSKH